MNGIGWTGLEKCAILEIAESVVDDEGYALVSASDLLLHPATGVRLTACRC